MLRLLYLLLSSTVPTPPIHTTDVAVINCWVYSRAKDSSSPMLSIFASASVSLPPLPSSHFPSSAIPPPSLPSPPSFLPASLSLPLDLIEAFVSGRASPCGRPLASNHLV